MPLGGHQRPKPSLSAPIWWPRHHVTEMLAYLSVAIGPVLTAEIARAIVFDLLTFEIPIELFIDA